jgi:microcystin-dependent protein
MGSSAFDPVALADTRTVKNKITHAGLTGDVLSVGDVVRWDPATDLYMLAKANSQNNANFLGVIESINATDFSIVYSGEISLPDSLMTTISGSTSSYILYLSDTNAGKLTTTAPTSPGSVIKPVIIISGTTIDGTDEVDGVVVNTAGDVIVGDSAVDISDIQPVGSILAFAGTTHDIPDGWSICDGGFLNVTTYSDLYTALNDGQLYGFIQGMTLDIQTTGTQVLNATNVVGKKFFVSKAGIDGQIECTILTGTPNASGTQVTGVSAFVNPLFIDGASAGSHHNNQLANNDLIRLDDVDSVYKVVSPSKTEFKKPDLRARFIIGDSRGITGLENSAFNSYTVGTFGGEEEHTLTTDEIPIHSHGISLSSFITTSGPIGVSFNLVTNQVDGHRHPNVAIESNKAFATGQGQHNVYVKKTGGTDLDIAGAHNHTVNGTINISANGLTPTVNGTIGNAGANGAHNNVPQHMVAIWIIKTRKDSVAKIYRLGPSGGGAIIAKNTAKRWARASSGAGCTVDISYGSGTWTVSRVGQGDYRFTHDMLAELGTANQEKYIVEATVIKNGSGATQMFLANPYSLQGLTFGVKVYDVMGATFSDNFQYLSLTIYGGGTAL